MIGCCAVPATLLLAGVKMAGQVAVCGSDTKGVPSRNETECSAECSAQAHLKIGQLCFSRALQVPMTLRDGRPKPLIGVEGSI